ncbi:hypothetical protein HDU77_002586 [Chytriomyces hyalinus]|nr:hypothetical protein HDU77_002586 [Chytriomyces hyalinus]
MDPGPAAVLATATRAAVHASLRGPVPPASVVEGQIVVLEVVTEVRVTLLEEFIIDHGMPVPVHPHATSAAAVSASFPSSTDTLVAVASQSNAAGDSNVLIYLGGQGQPSPTQSLLLSKEQTEVGVPSAVVAEIVVPLCAIFFCFGLLIAWRVIRKAQERNDRGGQNGVDWDGRDEENRGGPKDSSRSRLLRSLWKNLSRPKETQSRSDTPSIASSSSISTSSSLPPHDPDPDPLLEPGLAYPPALDFDTPSDPFAHARSRSAGQVNDISQMVLASAPPAEKFAHESNIPMSFLVATDIEERSSPSSPKTKVYPREASYFTSIPGHHSMVVSQSNQRSAPAGNLPGHNYSVSDTLLLLESLDAPPPAYSESSTAVLTLNPETCSEFFGLELGSENIHIPSAPPLIALAPESLVHVGGQMASELNPLASNHVQPVLARRRRSWSADASRAWLV